MTNKTANDNVGIEISYYLYYEVKTGLYHLTLDSVLYPWYAYFDQYSNTPS